jgi:mannose-6-phosphate isomerase-like protein (cupin superfamily)
VTAEPPGPRSIAEAIDRLTFYGEREPTTADEDMAEAFARLAPYRDGAVFVAHWAGTSEWERHPAGDEIVMVVGGETTLFLLRDGVEQANPLRAGELLVVPEGTWHRFETPVGVRVLSVTPQPTEHRSERPDT